MNDLGFILPLTMTVLGMTLLWVGVMFSRACLFWGSGYLMAALAFAMPLQGLILPPWAPLLAEALFVSAFFLYGQALMTQFPGRSALLPRLVLSIVSFCALAFTILILKDEDLELRFGDLSSALAILLPVALVIRRRKTPYGHALTLCAALVGLETTTRPLVSMLTSHLDPSMLMSSPYLLAMQGSAALFGHLMAIAALATAVHEKINSYRHAAERDALTGLLNRRGFERAIAWEPGRPAPGAVILCDIDHFKRINDTLGHAAGDQVIIGFAAVLQALLPRNAAVARHGGEEFIAFLPDHTAEQARILSQLLRQRLSATDALVLGSGWMATASFGVSGSMPGDATLADVIRRADRALYRAKDQGRDRVVTDMTRDAA